MANKTLDQLNDTGALAGTETIHVRDGGVDERSTVGAVVTLAQTGMASDAELAAHEADTTSVHGIADTSALLDSGDIGVSVEAAGTAATAVSNHAAATDPHGDRAYAAALVDDLSGVSDAATARTNLGLGTAAVAASGDFDAAGTAASAVAAHEADTTSVHGIADTSALLDTSDIGTTVQAYDVDIATVAASQAEMEAGTETALRSMSPARVAQAIAALAGSGGGDPLDANNIVATRIFGR